MAETFSIDNNIAEQEKYKLLVKQLSCLVNKQDRLISNLANVTAVLKQTFQKISWVGFYLYDGQVLYLGPFQGKVACTKIKIGDGVCGQAAKCKKSILVPNVYEFPGHIFCDTDSKSEIVIPVMKNNNLLAVLDLDSNEFNSFNEIDQLYLEQICNILAQEIF